MDWLNQDQIAGRLLVASSWMLVLSTPCAVYIFISQKNSNQCSEVDQHTTLDGRVELFQLDFFVILLCDI